MDIIEAVEILPFVGFGNVRLGMTKELLVQYLGTPDSTEADVDGNVALKYGNGSMQCTFHESDNHLLGSITFCTRRFVLQGIQIVGITLDRLRELIQLGLLP